MSPRKILERSLKFVSEKGLEPCDWVGHLGQFQTSLQCSVLPIDCITLSPF